MSAIDTAPSLEDVMLRIERILEAPDSALAASALAFSDELLQLGELTLESWVAARGVAPTAGSVEGFRLLALHRQGAQGDPSFNACRETCRELVYHHNLVRVAPADPDAARRIRLGAMVARHLALFIAGKLESAGLGEFCCSSRPLHQRGADSSSARSL
jgi:hypothetical protein